ncbi:serine hydrolase [Erythrobacter sp.]|jgi:beta-lactamase class A|uniref:serine hydrolase n=1 Tax=Erythrobacter sp. TaxID=1042 RepID=UPI002EC850D6|nr:serine hydrolase [Erythrobacter sp.]
MHRNAQFALPIALAALAPLGFAVPADAQDGEPMVQEPAEQYALEMRARQVVDLVNGDIEPEAIFTDSFLASVPPAQFKAISQQLTSQFGAALAVESLDVPGGIRSGLALRMERAIARGGITIDPEDENRVSGLLFQTFDPIGDSPEKIAADLAALPGTSNALLARLGDLDNPVFAHNPETQLALGSTFKLYVLSALTGAIESGRLAWDTVVPLDRKSLPSGQMQDWPDNSPITLHTLAVMMVSISDNTATDQLIGVLTREGVEAELIASGNADPSRTIPLLTTRELFGFRGVSEAFLARYRAADDEAQRAILEALTEDDVSQEQVEQTFASETPGAIDIEWFASPRDLAGLLTRISAYESDTALGVMAVRPSLPDSALAQWDYAGFKGGSEPGVLNLTWLLRDEAGEDWILTAGWNNPESKVETATLEAIAQRILALPR